MGKKKLSTISTDEKTQRLFRSNCKRYGLKMSNILEKSMETFNQTVENFEKMEEGNNDEIN